MYMYNYFFMMQIFEIMFTCTRWERKVKLFLKQTPSRRFFHVFFCDNDDFVLLLSLYEEKKNAFCSSLIFRHYNHQSRSGVGRFSTASLRAAL